MRCPAWILYSRSFRTTPSPFPHAKYIGHLYHVETECDIWCPKSAMTCFFKKLNQRPLTEILAIDCSTFSLDLHENVTNNCSCQSGRVDSCFRWSIPHSNLGASSKCWGMSRISALSLARSICFQTFLILTLSCFRDMFCFCSVGERRGANSWSSFLSLSGTLNVPWNTLNIVIETASGKRCRMPNVSRADHPSVFQKTRHCWFGTPNVALGFDMIKMSDVLAVACGEGDGVVLQDLL